MNLLSQRGSSARAVFMCLVGGCLALGALLVSAAFSPAHAQVLDKFYCGTAAPPPANVSSACFTSVPVQTAPEQTVVYYAIKIKNLSGTGLTTINLDEDYPSNFVPQLVTCTVTQGTTAPAARSSSTTVPDAANKQTITITGIDPNDDEIVCIIKGYFVDGQGLQENKVEEPIGNAISDVKVDLPAGLTLPTNLQITKTVASATLDPNHGNRLNVSGGPQNVTYRIEITNAGPNDVQLGAIFRLRDLLALPSSGVALQVVYVSATVTYFDGSTPIVCPAGGTNTGANDCLDSTAYDVNDAAVGSGYTSVTSSNWQEFIYWKYPGNFGHLGAGDKIRVDYTVSIQKHPDLDCVIAQDADAINNRGFLSLPGQNATIPDTPPGNNWADQTLGVYVGDLPQLDPDLCKVTDNSAPASKVTILKQQTAPSAGSVVGWGTQVDYTITITNGESFDIANASLFDLVEELAGTPLFTADAVTVSCSWDAACGTGVTGPQSLNGYFDTASVWNGQIPLLQAGQSVTITISLVYKDPSCDSVTNGASDIRNTLQLQYTTPQLDSSQQPKLDVDGNPLYWNYTLKGSADTHMDDSGACDMEVTKEPVPSTSTKLTFGQPFNYKVTFKNAGTAPHTFGTLFDAMLITASSNYANFLNVNYTWTCTATGSVTGDSTLPGTRTGTAIVQYTTPEHNGARIIANQSPITFAPGAILECDVQIVVDQPVRDQHCTGVLHQIENLALVDVSRWYHSNVPFPPADPNTTWSKTQTDLPKCYRVAVDKEVQPDVVTPDGGPLTYTITIQNLGDTAITGGDNSGQWEGLILADVFTGNLPVPPTTVSVSSPDPCASSVACVWLNSINGNPIGSQSTIGIANLAAAGQTGDTITLTYTVPGPYDPSTTYQDYLHNVATLSESGTTFPSDWYTTDVDNLDTADTQDSVEDVLVLETLSITKQLDDASPDIVLPSPLNFTFEVTCVTGNGQTRVFSLTLQPGETKLVNGAPAILIGSNCTIKEVGLPDLPERCTWNTPSTQTVFVTKEGENAITFVNGFTCLPPFATVDIDKMVSDNDVEVGDNVTFTMAVTNSGTSAIAPPGTITVTDVLPDGFDFVSTYGTHPDWTCVHSYSGTQEVVTCTYTGPPVQPGETLPYISIVAKATITGHYKNCAKVSVDGLPQSTEGKTEDCEAISVVEPPDCCCEEDCAYYAGDGDKPHCLITWSMLCCYLTLLLLFMILWILIWLVFSQRRFSRH